MLARYTFPFSSSKGRVRQVLSVLFSACLFFLCIVCLVKHAVKYVSIFYHRSFQKEFPKPRIHSFKFLIFNSNKFIKFLIRDHPLNNLFTTSNPPNIRIPILQIFVFVIEGGQENIFSLIQKIFSTNKKMFSCPPSITKTNIWRIGIQIFGGFDVVNKL